MKREEVIELLKKGKEIIKVNWDGNRYSLERKPVNYHTIQYLRKNNLIMERRSATSPLISYIRWRGR